MMSVPPFVGCDLIFLSGEADALPSRRKEFWRDETESFFKHPPLYRLKELVCASELSSEVVLSSFACCTGPR
jgi:hypothetical protein